MADCATCRESVARIAGSVLVDWKSGHCADLQGQIERSRRVLLEPSAVDVCEREKLEILLGALECLESARRETPSHGGENDRDSLGGERLSPRSVPLARVRAALRLLEHLANSPKK